MTRPIQPGERVCLTCKKIFEAKRRKYCGPWCADMGREGRVPAFAVTREPWRPRKPNTYAVCKKSCKRCGASFEARSIRRICDTCRATPLYERKPRRYPDCLLCKRSLENKHPNVKFCGQCSASRRRAYWLAGKMRGNHNEQSRMLTKYAVKIGFLPPPTDFKCADCGRVQAECYDHRDYSKPLEVDPVCLRCNSSRGRGIPVQFPCSEYVVNPAVA